MTSRRTRDRLIQRLMDQGISDYSVLDVIHSTPRHIFLDEALAHRAYEDSAIPIGYSQTLSQPYIVARMTELLLSMGPRAKVLEIGTGSGYQTAILAQLVKEVYSVERIRPLLDKAKERLQCLELGNVELRNADGAWGWAQAAPFDGIISAAAPRQIPTQLLDQLAPGGVLVIPVGDTQQQLSVVKRDLDSGEYLTELIEPVNFVPFINGVQRQ